MLHNYLIPCYLTEYLYIVCVPLYILSYRRYSGYTTGGNVEIRLIPICLSAQTSTLTLSIPLHSLKVEGKRF